MNSFYKASYSFYLIYSPVSTPFSCFLTEDGRRRGIFPGENSDSPIRLSRGRPMLMRHRLRSPWSLAAGRALETHFFRAAPSGKKFSITQTWDCSGFAPRDEKAMRCPSGWTLKWRIRPIARSSFWASPPSTETR